ncbi:DUF885 family protein [Novosphingobium sp.]|uniref:DUF885 domain-containing protein n=1 Tax=Novosphingobium sp. TaxID=1874826 RepID=UPI0022C319A3|nr:DUF885 domain-containing protein [Novosphingobium sp.]MCZ8017928.1 DUF885 domain-containing protein [Novosphingobium sp.]MCZ8034247.1 DUF885 domain-containing protein [Novosphingobium sp.]MCZ8052215.1 DUF885 domain-containing protein [Novosphingobium sp.]MCZ8061357.1 DUF885 domain-containing protein [Novosphingobium sp.]MCZ8232711.1 DUF885 domain-containing protein [Novosphingobium sp.]
MRKLTASLAFAALTLTVPTGLAAQSAPPPLSSMANADAALTRFLDAEFAEYLKTQPQLATRLGSKVGGDKWNDISDAAAEAEVNWRRASVVRMKAQFDRTKLSPEAQFNYDIWALEADRAALRNANRLQRPPFYSRLYSLHSQLPDFLVNTHSVADKVDLQNYIARLRGMPAVLDQAIERTRASEAAGVRVPRFQLETIIAGSARLTSGAPYGTGADAALWADVQAKTAALVKARKLTRAEADTMLAEARAAILDLKPAYDRVIDWAKASLPTAPSDRVGALTLPGGAEYYANELKLNTTTDLTADQIHEIGLKEVARIEAEQDALARQAGFKDRHEFYNDRARRFPPRPYDDAARAEYLKTANDFVARTRTLLPGWFGTLPAYGIEVVREPAFSEVPGGAAHASAPSPDGKRPARTYVHLVGNTPDPAALYTLMCHEAVPGHNMQGDIQVRQQGGPKFRAVTGYVAFGEGWALYAEAVCKEMGAYPDVAADFFRLDAELFRAARLVVDTGIHAKGWTEQGATIYMHVTGRQPLQRAHSEVRRYITLPGQATGYKIGMIKIMELRQRAEQKLGAKFDIKGFHDLLIASGSQPLSILERRVDEWIAARAG